MSNTVQYATRTRTVGWGYRCRAERLSEPAAAHPRADIYYARASSTSSKNLKNLVVEEDARLADDEPPASWIEWATVTHRKRRVRDVDFYAEWLKFVSWYAKHAKKISLHAWRRWVIGAKPDHTNLPASPETPSEASSEASSETPSGAAPEASLEASRVSPIPSCGTDQERARAASWVKTGKWTVIPPLLEAWGPAPDAPECKLPPALRDWALAARRRELCKTADIGRGKRPITSTSGSAPSSSSASMRGVTGNVSHRAAPQPSSTS